MENIKKLVSVLLFSIVCLYLATTVAYAQQTSGELYEKALYTEEVIGELHNAIDLYQQILENNPENKQVAAKALLHQGMCYEKLGNQEAVKKYRQLVDNFPGQKNEVALARERLSRLILIADKIVKTPVRPITPKFTKIKMPSNPDNGLLSLDGKLCAFISEGSVWVIPVSGGVDPYIAGEPKKLTDNIGAWDMNSTFAWSGDGKWIAFNAEVDFKSSSSSIYIIPSSGGNPQKVQVPSRRCGSLKEFRLSLSPDGKILAYASGINKFGDYDSQNTRIYTIPINGSKANELTGPGTHEPAYSPDGNKIAYVKSYKNNDGKRFSDVWVISSTGGIPIQVSNLQSGEVSGPVWSPDGKMIAFHRRPEREDPKEIWIVSITEEGSPSVAPRKIGLPLTAFHAVAGWTSENKIGLQLMDPMYEIIYTVPAKGGIATQVTPQGWTSYPKWSPDGKKIFFRWADGKIASVPSTGGEVDSIPIQSEFDIYTAVPGSGNDISPDGKTIVFSGVKNFYEEGEKRWEVDIFTIPIKGGKPKQLTTSGKLQDCFPTWSPDGNSIAFIRPQVKDNEPVWHICIISKEGKNFREITDESHKVAWAPIDWAPDGKSIAYFSDNKTIKSISVDGDGSRVLTKINKVNGQYELAWSPDGKKLAYTDNGKIWILSNDSGTTKEVKTGVDESPTKLCWSPDGKKIAFTAFAGGNNELWVMENFLPLDKLVQKKEAAEVTPKVMTNKKIWDESDTDLEGATSPDGQYLSYVDWDTGDLAIYEMATGKKRRLTNKGTWDESGEFALTSRWSPNGNEIVYTWCDGNKNCDLRIIGLEDSKPRILFSDKDVYWIYTYDWSRDGKQILAYFDKKDGANMIGQIVQVSTADGSERILKTTAITETGATGPDNLCFSTDGRYIVYDFPQKTGSTERDIFMISSDGNLEIPLVKHPAHDELLGWAPDGKNILFASDRNGTFSLWSKQIVEGKPQGRAELVKANMGAIEPLGFTGEGSFYYGSSQKNNNMYTAELDPKTGEVLALPKRTITRFEGYNQTPNYSPNGKYLAYISKRIPLTNFPDYTIGQLGGNVLVIKSLETGKEQEYFPDLERFAYPRWSPDGGSVIVMERKKSGSNRIDIQTGSVTPVLSDDNIGPQPTEFSFDGNTIFYVLRDRKANISRIIVKNLEGGTEKEIYRINGSIHIRLSPDGQWLAIQENYVGMSNKAPTLNIMPSAGGEQRILYRFEEGIDIRAGAPCTWTPDGEYILYTMKSPKKDIEKWDLYRIPAEGGKPEKLGIEMSGFITNLSVHPDGRHIAFSITEESNAEVWVMENFLPKEETVNKKK